MTRRYGERFCRGVPSQAVFGHGFLGGLAHPGSGLQARAECPLRMASGAGIGWLGSPESVRMPGLRLRFELRGVAVAAGRASNVAGTGILPG